MKPEQTREVALRVSPARMLALCLEPAGEGGDPELPARTLDHLDWGALCGLVADSCFMAQTRPLALGMRLFKEREPIARRLHEVDELVGLIEQGDRPPLSALEDVRPALARAGREATLEGVALRQIAEVARTSAATRVFFERRAEEAALLWQVAEGLASARELADAILVAFDPSGELTDAASPELGGLRRQVRRLHDRMRDQIERRVRSRELEPFLQDTYFTLREGRYVLPVRAQSRHRVEGIVHDSSASGQTVFVEPADLVGLNNEMRLAEFEVAAEEQRILHRLSGMVARHAEALARSYEWLLYLDLIHACAEFTCSVSGVVPTLSEREVALRQARHPVLERRLAARDEQVVANDIAFGGEAPILVISGSNAGGKTVSLKTVGVLALMLRAGLPIPADPGSAMPLFTRVFTDIGDEQSIQNDTSTFSAHLLNLRGFLERVDERTLLLLDEPFAGTDPAHAAALAIALLEYLRERGALSMVTTHLDKLKAYALEEAWLANASVGFDLDELRPTYVLHLGTPGGSHALPIARRMALPLAITQRAAVLLEEDPKMSIEVILRDLEAERTRLLREREGAERSREDADKLQRRLEDEIKRARDRQLDALDRNARDLRKQLRDARRLVARHIKSLQDANKPHEPPPQEQLQAASEALRGLEGVPQQIDVALREQRDTTARDALDAAALEEGARVWSRGYQRQVTVLRVDRDRGQATVQLGPLKADVALDDLRTAPEASDGADSGRGRRKGAAATPAAPLAPAHEAEGAARPLLVQTAENTCDLRGLTVEEALERLELFLDWAYRRELSAIYVIHGHGTGALKRAVRTFAPRSRYLSDFRPGEHGEGGDGVTVMWLR